MATVNLQKLDLETLVQVVDTARSKAANNPQWLNTINTAYDYLLTSADTITILPDGIFLIPSATTSTVYSANGVCQCHAFQNGKVPCWHRAIAHLITRYREALEQEADRLMWATDRAEKAGNWKHHEWLSKRWEAIEGYAAGIGWVVAQEDFRDNEIEHRHELGEGPHLYEDNPYGEEHEQ